MTINIEHKPLAKITEEAIDVLLQKLGAVNTVRFLSQFSAGYGSYADERELVFGQMTLDEIIADIKREQTDPR